MHFDLKAPCANCPFRRSGVVPLHAERIRDLAINMTRRDGVTFACHKTSTGPDRLPKKDWRHCAGALIFAEKNDNGTAPMRLAQGLGIYDPGALMDPGNRNIHDLVCDNVDEVMEVHRMANEPSPAPDG